MVFNIQPYERKIFELIQETAKELGYPAYVVGGYVRDRLISRKSKDIDVVCVGDGIKLAEGLAYKMRPIPRVVVYSRFGTAMLKHKDIEIEFVGARKESYSQNSRKPDVEEGSLEDDQNRRDFTINALALSLNEDNFGEIIDPFNGLLDLEQKILRTPLDPGKTFSDDPLRILRAIRFACQLDFRIEEETYHAISKYRNRISIVSKERITTEMNKILSSPKPSIGLNLLFETELLKNILPELADLHGVEVRDGIGHKDNFYHTLEVVDNVARRSTNLWLGHEALGAIMVPKIFKRLRLPLDHKMKYVQNLVRLHLRPISLTKENITDSAIRRLLFDAGEDLEDLMILCQSDITSKNYKKVQRYQDNYNMVKQRLAEVEEKDKIRNWQPPISGEEIMHTFGLAPSRKVGDIKTAIREAILDGEIENNYEAAKAFMMEVAKAKGISTPMS